MTTLSIGEAARYLKLSIGSVRRSAERGDLPYWVTPGGHRRFRTEDLDRFARQWLGQQR